jgi:hypothetical protein
VKLLESARRVIKISLSFSTNQLNKVNLSFSKTLPDIQNSSFVSFVLENNQTILPFRNEINLEKSWS